MFDIETTGLGNDCEVTQLAACLLSGAAKSFAQYVLPSGQISKEASTITKLTTRRESGRTILRHDGMEGPSATWEVAEEKFAAWLERARPPGPFLLLAHDAFSFDAKVLLRVASGRLLTIVSGFADSLPAFCELLPGRKG